MFFFASWLVLKFWKVDIDVVPPRGKNRDIAFGREIFPTEESTGFRKVTVSLDGFGLGVQTRRLGRRSIRKTILQPITAIFEPGKINAVLGPSGSGKTSLLQSLARRLNSTLSSKYQYTGNILLNGATPSPNVIKSVASFVTQDDDALLPFLTVRETLRLAACLRLPSWMSKDEKHRRAEEVLLKMGLKDCASHTIGGELKKGISGGERRRVSIAIQILTDPKVLVLDEPTSGLDTFTATSVIELLKKLADEGRTIIMTIHQARSDIFNDFDNLLLLARGGSTIYQGPGEEVLPYFHRLGFNCPRTTNPADFILDLITVDLQREDKETISRERVRQLIDAWEIAQQPLHRSSSAIATPAELSSLRRQTCPFQIALPLILQRSALNIRRSPDLLIARTSQAIGITIIFTLFFAPLKSNYEAVQSRMGFVQEVAALYFVGMLQNLAVYPKERDTFYREFADGCYTTSTFLVSYTLLEIPFTILSSLIFGVLAAFAIAAKSTAAFFAIAALNCFCVISCGESLGIIFCTVFPSHVGFALNVTCVFLTIATTLGGVMSLNIPSILQAFNHLSPLKYQVANMAVYSMRRQTFSCTTAQEVNGSCPITTGEQVLELYNLNKNPDLNLTALCVTAIIYRIVAYAVLKAAKTDWGLSQGSKSGFARTFCLARSRESNDVLHMSEMQGAERRRLQPLQLPTENRVEGNFSSATSR